MNHLPKESGTIEELAARAVCCDTGGDSRDMRILFFPSHHHVDIPGGFTSIQEGWYDEPNGDGFLLARAWKNKANYRCGFGELSDTISYSYPTHEEAFKISAVTFEEVWNLAKAKEQNNDLSTCQV